MDHKLYNWLFGGVLEGFIAQSQFDLNRPLGSKRLGKTPQPGFPDERPTAVCYEQKNPAPGDNRIVVEVQPYDSCLRSAFDYIFLDRQKAIDLGLIRAAS